MRALHSLLVLAGILHFSALALANSENPKDANIQKWIEFLSRNGYEPSEDNLRLVMQAEKQVEEELKRAEPERKNILSQLKGLHSEKESEPAAALVAQPRRKAAPLPKNYRQQISKLLRGQPRGTNTEGAKSDGQTISDTMRWVWAILGLAIFSVLAFLPLISELKRRKGIRTEKPVLTPVTATIRDQEPEWAVTLKKSAVPHAPKSRKRAS